MIKTVLHGIGICDGIAVGQVHLVDRRRFSYPRYSLKPGGTEAELERFERAVETSEKQLDALSQTAGKSSIKEIGNLLDVHKMMLRDVMLHKATRELIVKENVNAEWALVRVVKGISEKFDKLDGDYFRERRSDVNFVSDRVLKNLIGTETDPLNEILPNTIVVAYDLSVSDAVALSDHEAKAFVTEAGSQTSHLAILARSMNVPAVLGVNGIMNRVGSGDGIVVDGTAGDVMLRPTQSENTRFQVIGRQRAAAATALLADRHLPAETTDGVRVSLLGNIDASQDVESVIANGGEGIGLYRSELMVIKRQCMPTAEEHAAEYKRAVQLMNGGVVTIRTVDLGNDKLMGGSRDGASRRVSGGRNPALGLRAIRYSLRDVPSFKAQLRGILEASAYGKVRLLFPFISCVEELREAKSILEETRHELEQAGVSYDREMKIGVMIETPAVVWMADALAKESDFFSLGTNDLIQYATAADRENIDVAHLYQASAPAVIRMLNAVMQAALSFDMPVCLCGEMAAQPLHVPLLLGLGIRSLSMRAHAIPIVKRLIRGLSVTDCETLLQATLEFASSAEVEAEVSDRLRSWVPDFFSDPSFDFSVAKVSPRTN